MKYTIDDLNCRYPNVKWALTPIVMQKYHYFHIRENLFIPKLRSKITRYFGWRQTNVWPLRLLRFDPSLNISSKNSNINFIVTCVWIVYWWMYFISMCVVIWRI